MMKYVEGDPDAFRAAVVRKAGSRRAARGGEGGGMLTVALEQRGELKCQVVRQATVEFV